MRGCSKPQKRLSHQPDLKEKEREKELEEKTHTAHEGNFTSKFWGSFNTVSRNTLLNPELRKRWEEKGKALLSISKRLSRSQRAAFWRNEFCQLFLHTFCNSLHQETFFTTAPLLSSCVTQLQTTSIIYEIRQSWTKVRSIVCTRLQSSFLSTYMAFLLRISHLRGTGSCLNSLFLLLLLPLPRPFSPCLFLVNASTFDVKVGRIYFPGTMAKRGKSSNFDFDSSSSEGKGRLVISSPPSRLESFHHHFYEWFWPPCEGAGHHWMNLFFSFLFFIHSA